MASQEETENDTVVHSTEKKHIDGTIDLVSAEAIGGEVEELPPGYFRNAQFIGTVVVSAPLPRCLATGTKLPLPTAVSLTLEPWATCVASICAYLGWVLPANTLDLINAELGPSKNINWVGTAWTLGSSIGFLLVGRLGDVFGRRGMVLACNGLGLAGCVAGATAATVGALAGAGLLNGAAAAGQLSHNMILGELVPQRRRGPVAALVFLSSLPVAVFGPALARLLILRTRRRWRWSFYLGAGLAALALALYAACYRPPRYRQLHVGDRPRAARLRVLDFGGLALWAAGVTLFLVGLSWAGTAYPWRSPHVLVPLLAGVATLVAFGLYEQYVVKGCGIMPPRLLANLEFVALVMIATLSSMVYYSMTVLWPTLIQTVFDADVMAVGWQSSVVGGGVLLGQMISGFSIACVPRVKLQTVVASVLAAALVASLAGVRPDLHAATLALGVLATVAVGFNENVAYPGVTLIFDACDIGLASGALGSIRAMGGAIAQALYVSILNTQLAKNMETKVVRAAVDAGLPSSSLPALLEAVAAGNFSSVPGATEAVVGVIRAGVQDSYVSSFRVVFYATIPFGVLLVGFAFLVPNMDKYLSGNVARRLQNTKSSSE